MDFIIFLPIFIMVLGITYFYIKKNYHYSRFREFKKVKNKGLLNALLYLFYRYLTPKPGSRLHNFYSRFLIHRTIDVKTIFLYKSLSLVIGIILLSSIKLTNIYLYTQEIYNNFYYKVDYMGTQNKSVGVEKAFEEEMMYFEIAKKRINNVIEKDKSIVINTIYNIIDFDNKETELDIDILSEKVYIRLLNYHKVRRINYPITIFILISFYFLPNIIVFIKNIFTKVDSKIELMFLKKLFILNGSIKPVNFRDVLSILIKNSNYYKTLLIDVESANNSNKNIEKFYRDRIRQSKELDEKLFLEKLEQANNIDFDQAVINIKNEFKIDKKERSRKVKKRIKWIEIIGGVGFIIILGLTFYYLLKVWMDVYNVNDFTTTM